MHMGRAEQDRRCRKKGVKRLTRWGKRGDQIWGRVGDVIASGEEFHRCGRWLGHESQ